MVLKMGMGERENDKIKKSRGGKMIKLKCPNCGKAMVLAEENRLIEGDYYDYWNCGDCLHIIVLDWRSSKCQL